MVDVSEGGAAFLVGSEAVPGCGEVVGLREMFSADCHVRAVARALPPEGRVVRVEESGLTRRVAVRFEESAGVGARVVELVEDEARARQRSLAGATRVG